MFAFYAKIQVGRVEDAEYTESAEWCQDYTTLSSAQEIAVRRRTL